MIRSAVIALLAGPLMVSSESAAQRLTEGMPASPEKVALAVGGQIGGKNYQASGTGTCRHAPDASLDGVSASLWKVQLDGADDADVRELSLTLWRLKDGSPDQLSLSLETGSGNHRIETGKNQDAGEGSVTILPNGPGGRLEIRGKDKRGKTLQLTIDCPTFAALEAEGG